MTLKNRLILLKIIHTILWIIIILLIGYVWYCDIFNKINKYLWVSIVCITSEGLILWSNDGICPLTRLAKKYTNNRKPGFDIYLPKWLAKYNIPLFTLVSIFGIFLAAFRYLIHIFV